MSKPMPILFTHFGEDWLRGAEYVLLDLMGQLNHKEFTPVVWCNSEKLADACRSFGYPTYRSHFEFYFDYPSSSPPFSLPHYASLVREAVSIIRRHNIHVVHANSAAPTQWLVPAVSWTNRPLLTHLHIGYLRRSRYVLMLHQSDLLVGVATDVTRSLLQDGVPPQRVRTIHNGIDPNRLVPSPNGLRARLGIGSEALLIGCIGSLIMRKGYDILLKSLALLDRELDLPHTVIGGYGEDADRIMAMSRELGLEKKVHFIGQISDPASLYVEIDIFALAARREGLPLVLAEAGYFGVPTVCTDVGGVPEIVVDGETGLVVPPENPGALAAALRRLIEDPLMRKRLGDAARRRVVERFTVQSMAQAFEGAYTELAAMGRLSSFSPSRLKCYIQLLRKKDEADAVRNAR